MQVVALVGLVFVTVALAWLGHRALVRWLDDQFAEVRPAIEISVTGMLLAALSYVTAWRYWLDRDLDVLFIVAGVAALYALVILFAWWLGRRR